MLFLILYLGAGIVIGFLQKEPDSTNPEEEVIYILRTLLIIMAWPLWMIYWSKSRPNH
ncbi:hypothetical protein MUN89_15430 [Halobacillus salinarum]|uniref:Uncharacterized protein n=1 Tax=Halobacillus salinarum TaxID=2932257 RepID=A0ABY4EGX1_9BACI|nr:hypothetical protein [Halobacillus salinarum]UOQ43302.1 hypothetical protein MUN89_15430 [Halobacillus salinarum]